MQIHDLNTKTLTDPAYVAFDDGTDTYKADFKAEIDNAAASAVADADLTDNTVAFTSGDSSSPTEWTAVDVLTSGLSLKTLFNRISTMIKNVRYIWSKIGTASMGTTATTITGAIAEHESDISTLNSKLTIKSYTANPAANSVVSPFSAYAEMIIPSADLSAYGTPVAIMMSSGGSANPVTVKMNGSRTGFWVYAKNTTPVVVYVLFMK